MTSSLPSCSFKLWFRDDYHCPFPSRLKGVCIFHLTKLTKDEKDKLSAHEFTANQEIEEEFRLALTELLEKESADSKKKVIDLRGFSFPAVNWKGKEFVKKLDFHDATFKQEANFDKAVFHQKVDFHSTKFVDHLSCSQTRFKAEAFFGAVIFSGAAMFSDAIFEDEAIFLSEFRRVAYFHGACFNQKADFLQARFDERALFPKTSFRGEAWFHGAVFRDLTNFVESSFAQTANFSNSFFEGTATFAGASFGGRVSFRYASFSKEGDFRPRQNKCILNECDFSALVLKKDSELNFDQVNLSRAHFVDTDLEKITFRSIDWKRKGLKRAFRAVLWDEVSPLQEGKAERDYEKIAENYRQLVLNYESKRDYDLAEEFHVGEMEMRRKKLGSNIKSSQWRKLRETLNAYGLYWLLSRYGTSYWQAFAVLLLLLLSFSTAFLYTGFQPSKENVGKNSRVIEYNCVPDDAHHAVSVRQWISDYKEAILFSLSIITFQRERFYEPIDWQSQFVLYLAVLAMTTQAALLFLSIRRRFRR
jgi:uncharacterized protein YjbI with pentapeptide repeats